MPYRFFMRFDPPTVTAQERRVGINRSTGKPYLYDTAELRAAKNNLAWHLRMHKPAKPFTGPLRLYVRWQFDCGRNSHRDGEWRKTRPDTDNLNKALKDQMTRVGFWRDDAQVVREEIEKIWSLNPGIYIEVEQVDQMRL